LPTRKERPQHTPRQLSSHTPPAAVEAGLERAARLLDRQRWSEACTVLSELDERYPNRIPILSRLAEAYHGLKDGNNYLAVCEQLVQLAPQEPEYQYNLAGAYLMNIKPALGLRTLRHFLERWPDHELAAEARPLRAELESHLDELLAELGLSGSENLVIAEWHEEAQWQLSQGRSAEARQLLEKILKRQPRFVPALNNLSLLNALEGKLGAAIALAQRALDADPDNFHARANLVQYFCRTGQLAAARAQAEQLQTVQSSAFDLPSKKAEAFSYLGDDETVVAAFQAAQAADQASLASDDPMLWHLAAVALYRLGRENEARRQWRQLLQRWPDFRLAQDNLEDLKRPVGERQGPWPFHAYAWLDMKLLEDLISRISEAVQQEDDSALGQVFRWLAREHPEVTSLIPLLLDRGDPLARNIALSAALFDRTPENLAALRDFALGQRGPDSERHQAAQAAVEAGLLPSGMVRLWLEGRWQEVLLVGFELHDEPTVAHGPQVKKLLEKVAGAFKANDGAQIEALLKEALALEPESPDLLNNLALSYQLQGRAAEAQALTQQIHERFPDYLFTIVSLARSYIAQGEISQAEALLEPLFSRKRFHFSEFAVFCDAQIALNLAKEQPEGARTWLALWADVAPDDPRVAEWQALLARPQRPRRKRS